MEQAILLEKVKAATVDVLTAPGPLASRPRQIESFAKLDVRLDDPEYEGDLLKVYFDIAGGIGKTVMFGQLGNKMIARGLRPLFVTPRVELVNQTDEKFELHFDGEADIAVIHSKEKRRAPTVDTIEAADAAVITNASLISQIRSGRLNPLDWDVVIWDEAHLAIAGENLKLIQGYQGDDAFIPAAFSHAFQMAFTASGEYTTAHNVANIFGPPVDSINTADGVEGNLLASIKTSVVHSNVRIGIDNIPVHGDYDPIKLQKSVNISARNLIAAQLYANFSDPETGYRMLGERGMLFCVGVDHARQVAALFNREIDPLLASHSRTKAALRDDRYQLLRQPEAEITRAEYDKVQISILKSLWESHERRERRIPALPAVLIHGHTTTEHQRLIHDCFEVGLIKAVANADMWTFGIDKPFATFALNLAPTTSLPKCIQRGTRVDRIDPKRPDKVCYVVDILDEDVWEQIQAAASDPKLVLRNLPRLFAQVLNWRPSVSNSCMPRVTITDPQEPLVCKMRAPIYLELKPGQVLMSHKELVTLYNTYEEATKKQTIEITDEMRAELNAQMTRTGYGSYASFVGLQKSHGLPVGLKNCQTIEAWRKGLVKTTDPYHWTAVMQWQSEQPDVTPILDEDVWEKMQAAARDPKIIFRIRPRLFAEVLNWRSSISNAFMPQLSAIQAENNDKGSGEKRGSAHLQLSHDQVVMSQTALTAIYNTFQQAAEKQTIEITDEMRAELNSQMTRTGCASMLTFKGLQESGRLPEGLNTSSTIEDWRRGKTKTADPLHWATVMDWQVEQPDATPKQTIPLTDEMLEELEGQIARTGCGPTLTFKGLQASGRLPDGLNNDAIIRNWRNGNNKTVDPLHWAAVMEWQREQPDATPKQMIPITDEMRAELNAQITRTGCGPTLTFKGLQESNRLPERLNSGIIESWSNGHAKTADPIHWAAVMEWQKEQQDLFSITGEMRAELNAQMIRTGCWSSVTFNGLKKSGRLPEGLKNYTMIDTWRNGSAKIADPRHWTAVIDWQREQPDATPKQTILITDEMLAELEGQIARTGCGPTLTFRGLKENGQLPKGVKRPGMIDSWRSGDAKTVDPRH